MPDNNMASEGSQEEIPVPREVLRCLLNELEWSQSDRSANLWGVVRKLLDDAMVPGKCDWSFTHTRDDCGHAGCQKA
jgi:hypothetical protein